MLYEIQLNSPFRSFDRDDGSNCNYNYSTNVFDFVEEPETAPEGRTYGVEIELNPVRTSRQNFVNGIHQVFDLSPTFIVKSDSTISEYGGEIVTVPLGLDAMPALFEAIEASAPGQYTVTNACGVHIHAAVPNNIWTLARMYMIVMSRNSLAFGSHVFGRQPGDFHMRGEYTIRPSDAVDWARGRQRGNHRTALEFSNKGTLELRSFAGTTKATDLMCYAEYYDALIEFCSKRVQGVSIDDLNILAQFSAFVLASESRWPALATRLRCGSVEIIAGSTSYNHAVRGLFLPRASRTPEPRQPRLPAAVLDELNDLTTLGITLPDWQRSPATPRSNAISGTVAQTLETRRTHFREMVEDRIQQSDEDAPFNRPIGIVGFNGSVATYAWLLRAIVRSVTLRSAILSIDDYRIEVSRTGMYAAINRLFSGRFTSSRGTIYAGRRLYTLILNYHLPRAFALINGTANTRPYGQNYCMDLTLPSTYLPTPPDRRAAQVAAEARIQNEIDRVYSLTDGEFERELAAQVAAEARVQNEIDRQVAGASAPLTNFPTPLQAALFPTREQVAESEGRLIFFEAARERTRERPRANYERTRGVIADAIPYADAIADAISYAAAIADAENLRNEENVHADLATAAAVTRRIFLADTQAERDHAYDAVLGIFGLAIPPDAPLPMNEGQTGLSAALSDRESDRDLQPELQTHLAEQGERIDAAIRRNEERFGINRVWPAESDSTALAASMLSDEELRNTPF